MALALGVLPAVASKALGKENAGFGFGLLPGLMYKEHHKKKQAKRDAAGREVPAAAEAKEGMKKGGKAKAYAAGGSASKRADGCAVKGKTRGKMV
jgi:hypothetical protein